MSSAHARIDKILLLALLIPLIAAAESQQDEPEAKEMERVVVVATRTERPLWRVASQVTTFHRDDLQFLQVRDLGDIARYEPGVEPVYDGVRFADSSLSIRGIGGNRVAMVVDDIPLPTGFSIGEFSNSGRASLDPAILERVEILRGPASALYGSDAIGGVVSLTSTDPAMLARAGNYFGAGSGWSGADDSVGGYVTTARQGANHGLLFSLNHRRGDEPDHSVGTTEDTVDYRQWQGLAKWTMAPVEGDQFELAVDRYEREVKSDLRSVLGYGRQYARTIALHGDDDQERTRVSAEYRAGRVGVVDQLTILAYRQDGETRQRTTDLRADRTTGEPSQLIERVFDFESSRHGLGIKLRETLDFGVTSHDIVAGVEWSRQELIEARDGQSTDLVTGEVSKTLPPGETLPQRDLPRTRTDNTAIYIQNEIIWGDVTLIPGIRWDRFDLDASTDALLTDPSRLTDLVSEEVTARLGATGRFSDTSSWYIHYAEGFRAPPPEDVNLYLDYSGFVTVRALPNPDLRAEKSRNYETGVRFESGGTFAVIGGYWSRYRNFIESRALVGVDPADGALLFQSRNRERTTIYGFEGRLRQRLDTLSDALAGWTAEAGFHWTRGEDDSTGQPLNLVSPTNLVVGLDFSPVPEWMLGMRVKHIARQTRTDFSEAEFFVPPEATVFDILGRWSPASWLEVNAGIYNLADEGWWRYDDVRRLPADDPRVTLLSRPGTHAAITVHLQYR